MGADGNLSLRRGERVLITPSQVAYDELEPASIAELDLEGRGGPNPSSEREVHLAVYRKRVDVQAVIHAHPVHACVLAVLRQPLPEVLDEVAPVLGGGVGVAEYAASGTPELGRSAAAALGQRQAVLLANHGSVTVGRDLAEAFYRLEVLERAARVYLLARLAGDPTFVPPPD